jgi:hypothetical protein
MRTGWLIAMFGMVAGALAFLYWLCNRAYRKRMEALKAAGLTLWCEEAKRDAGIRRVIQIDLETGWEIWAIYQDDVEIDFTQRILKNGKLILVDKGRGPVSAQLGPLADRIERIGWRRRAPRGNRGT